MLRKILNAHAKTPKESLYLETGSIPIRYIIIQRRMNYLHHLINRNPNELINKVYCAQKRKMAKNDWVETVQNNLNEINLNLSDDSNFKISKKKFKKFIKGKINEAAFKYLNKIKSSHSKVKNINYEKVEIQPYLIDTNFSTKEKQLLFRLRTRMTNVKMNFSSSYQDLTCNLCSNEFLQSDFHLLECEMIIKECPKLSNDVSAEYEDLFGSLTEQLSIIKLYSSVFETKNLLEEKRNSV